MSLQFVISYCQSLPLNGYRLPTRELEDDINGSRGIVYFLYNLKVIKLYLYF